MRYPLKIISKQEFATIYRFGFIPKDYNRIISENEGSDSFNDLLVENFLKLPYFTGDEEYLIIKYKDGNHNKKNIEIDDLVEVIPCTRAAKASLELKFDSKIKFSSARFEDQFSRAEFQIDLEDKIRGGYTLCRILEIEPPSENILNKDDVQFLFQARRDGLKSDKFEQSFFVHLLAYDRYEFYPNTDLGYLYDVGEVFANSIGKPHFKGSGYHKFLESIKEIKREEQLSKLIDIVERTDQVAAFKSKCSSKNLKNYLIGLLYLMFKNDLINAESVDETSISKKVLYIKKNNPYVNELRHAIYLVGLFFGYEKFYSDFYRKIGLNIFENDSIVDERYSDKKTKCNIESKKSTKQTSDSTYKKTVEEVETVGVEDLIQTELSNDVSETSQEGVESKDAVNIDDENLSKEKVDQYEAVRAKIIEFLKDCEGNKVEMLGDVTKKFEQIISPLVNAAKPTKKTTLKILRKDFSDIIKIKKGNMVHLIIEQELDFT